MPIYEYQCAKCGSVFEALQKFSDAPLKKHENCGGKVERLISASGFHLKGGGWYVTDYGRGGGAKKSDSGEAKKETKSESSSETKTETKSESTAKKD